MTGDIRAQLASSEAAESLRMEAFIAGCFRQRQWPAERGVYYNDPETGKAREIDVISRNVLERPRRQRNVVGAPLINLSIFCECKSLAGWNVLLAEGDVDKTYENRMICHWSGYEEHIREAVETLSQDPMCAACDKKLLYSYYNGRAYPDHRAIAYHHLHLAPPPVEMIATAFRETKSGNSGRSQGSVNPFWGAVQSVLAATKAAEAESLARTRSYTIGTKSYSSGESDFVHNNAFFFDAELNRAVFLHPVVFCKLRLFRLTDRDAAEVRSARLYVLICLLNIDT
jgi:hypothetical protein